MTAPNPEPPPPGPPPRRRRLRPAGNYRQLASFQTTTLIYDATVWFCVLDQQLAALEEAFIEGGGYSEQLATARLTHRTHSRHPNPQDPPDQPDPADPIPKCPQCAKPMALRTAKAGPNAGSQFWGCTGYPDCRGTAEL